MKPFHSEHLKDLEDHLHHLSQVENQEVQLVSKWLLNDLEMLKVDIGMALYDADKPNRDKHKKWLEEMGYGPNGEEL